MKRAHRVRIVTMAPLAAGRRAQTAAEREATEMPRPNFGDSLLEHVRRKESQVVVGLDPRLALMPPDVRPPEGRSGPDAAADSIIAFNRAVVDAVREHAVAVKCQIAFLFFK